MQTLTLILAANQTVAFDISGSYFEIIDSVGLVSINFYDASGSRTKDLELLNVLSGFFVKGRYSRFEINESSGTSQKVTVLYGAGEGGTRRSPGTVRIIDSSADKTSAGAQYFQGISANPVSGNMSWVFVRAGVGRVAIKRLQVQSATGGSIAWGTGDSTGTLYTGASKYPLTNKYINKPNSPIAQVGGSAQTAGYPPTASESPNWVQRGTIAVAANVPAEFPLTTPLILENGAILGLCGNLANRDVALTVDCEEL